MSNEEIINESIILTNDAAKRVSAILKLGNAGWAGNILATLYGKNLIGRKEADINTGGRKTYNYFAK